MPFTFQIIHQSPGDKHLPARQGKSIDGLLVSQNMKLKRIIGLGCFTVTNDIISNILNNGLIIFIRFQAAKFGGHFRRGLDAQRDFLFLGDADVLVLAGNRVIDF